MPQQESRKTELVFKDLLVNSGYSEKAALKSSGNGMIPPIIKEWQASNYPHGKKFLIGSDFTNLIFGRLNNSLT